MTKKITVLLLSGLLAASAALADSTVLRVNLKDGTSATYVLEKKPRVTFEEGLVLIESEGTSTNYRRSDVCSFSFESTSASISGMHVESDIVYRYADNIFQADGRPITVYNLNGNAVTYGNDRVSLAELPAGVYIVLAGRQSVKIIKK